MLRKINFRQNRKKTAFYKLKSKLKSYSRCKKKGGGGGGRERTCEKEKKLFSKIQ